MDRRKVLQTTSIFFAGTLASCAPANSLSRPGGLTNQDLSLLRSCKEAILSGQLSNGSIPLVAYTATGRPADIDHYFTHLACLGLLSAYVYEPDIRILNCISAWLNWCIDNQEIDGTWMRLQGKRGVDGSFVLVEKKFPDSHDSYAGLFLALASRYISLSKSPVSDRLVNSCKQCLMVLERCKGSNGLYWQFDLDNNPTNFAAQYLLDNIEVHQGFVAAEDFFRAANDMATAVACQERASELAKRMHRFWYADQTYFVVLQRDVVSKVAWGIQPVSLVGLASVSALAFFENLKPKTRNLVWQKLIDTYGKKLDAGFSSDEYFYEDPTIERMYFAALKAGSITEQSKYLSLLRTRAQAFIWRNRQLEDNGLAGLEYPRVHRYGMIIQALLAGLKFPDELPSVPLDPSQAP
jgi:hypothetical protein